MNNLKAAIVVEEYPQWLNNSFFSGGHSFGFKSDIEHFVALRVKLKEHGINLNTHDLEDLEECKLILNFDKAGVTLPKIAGQIKYLIVHDTFAYHYNSWLILNHVNYDKIFIWNPDVVDNKKYFYYNLPIDIDLKKPKEISAEEYAKRTLCAIVSSEHTVTTQKIAYGLNHERYKIVYWFARNAPDDFRLFGRGWKEAIFRFRGREKMKRILPASLFSIIEKRLVKKNILYKIYGGEIGPLDKISKIGQFNFYLCYENSTVNGWITEKIFECFSASCVPIYLGAANICDYIPENCFIDRRNFSSEEELCKYIKNMPYEEYAEYLNNATAFLAGKGVDRFKIDGFVENLTQHILTDLKIK